MSTVLIVGAGGSLGQAASLRPVRSREHPPLDANFFEKAENLSQAVPAIDQEIKRLRQSIAVTNLFFDPFEGSAPSLEQYFADVYYEVAAARSQAAFSVFVRLLRLYNRVLGDTTNWIAQQSRLGVLDRVIRREAAASDGRLTILTFNQDLLLENVALRFPRSKNRWCRESLYDNTLLQPLYRPDEVTFRDHDDKCPCDPPFRLLKLHGSLNWGLRSRDRNPTLATLFPNQQRDIFMLDTALAIPGQRLTVKGQGRRSWYLWPLVVPPIYEKHRLTGNRVISRVWQRARKAISQANRLVILGYSLPDADVSAAQMLRRAFTDNSELDAVYCVNPDATVVAKLRDRLGCRVIHTYSGMPTYLEHVDSAA